MRIPEILKSFKGQLLRDIYLVLLVFLVGLGSFGLGRLSGLSDTQPDVRICRLDDTSLSQTSDAPSEPTSVPQITETSLEASASAAGSYVASKNGKAYHLPWCSGAQRIKPENKIWFKTKEEAQSAGYAPAANCKGI